MCEERSPIAFESQEGLQGRRAEVLKRSFEVSKSFKFIQSHSKSSHSGAPSLCRAEAVL